MSTEERPKGLQHTLNNPLAALLTNSSLLSGGMVPEGERAAILEAIDEQARRIAAVVKRLSALEDPRTVEYARGQRMVDLGPKGDA